MDRRVIIFIPEMVGPAEWRLAAHCAGDPVEYVEGRFQTIRLAKAWPTSPEGREWVRRRGVKARVAEWPPKA